MKNKELFKKLSSLGFPLFETEERVDANATLSEVVKSKDTRLWEGFPVLLVNANKNGEFSYEATYVLLKDKNEKSTFLQLVLLSLLFYRVLHLKFWWANKLYGKLALKNKNFLESFSKSFKQKKDVKLFGQRLNYQRMESMFSNYFKKEEASLKSMHSKQEELSLEYALSRVFSPKQKELFLKKFRGEKLTKTEKEYFSRVVKKKALALANPQLHQLVRKVLKF